MGYRRIDLLGALAGFPLILDGVHLNFQAGWAFRYSFFAGSQYNYWGSLGIAVAWICLVVLACKPARSRKAM